MSNDDDKKRKKKKGPVVRVDGDVDVIEVTRQLPQTIDDDEARRLGLEHARVTLAIEKHETELAAYRANKLKELRPLRKEDRRLARAVEANAVLVDVKCEERRIFKQNTVVIVRMDTGQEIDRRAMTPEERQRSVMDAPAGERVEG